MNNGKLIPIDEAAKELHLDVASLIRYLIVDGLEVLVNLDEIDLNEVVSIIFEQNDNDFQDWASRESINKNNQSMLTKFSRFKLERDFFNRSRIDISCDDSIPFNNDIDSFYVDEKRTSVRAILKGVWGVNQRYLKRRLSEGVFPLLNLSKIHPYGELYNNNFLSVDAPNRAIGSSHSLYISNESFDRAYNYALDGGKINKKRNYSYLSQGEAQKERHAAKRESVLMAAISIYKRFPNECSKNSARWGALLWDHAHEYWKDSNPPLSQDEIVRLLRRASKAPN
jgi:hypothetical protein